MSPSVATDLELLMTAAIAERESTALLSSAPITTRDSPRRISLSPDPMVESSAAAASSPESSELSCLKKSRPSSVPSKPPRSEAMIGLSLTQFHSLLSSHPPQHSKQGLSSSKISINHEQLLLFALLYLSVFYFSIGLIIFSDGFELIDIFSYFLLYFLLRSILSMQIRCFVYKLS